VQFQPLPIVSIYVLDPLEAAMTGVSVFLFFIIYIIFSVIIFVVDFILKKR
jgi:hypothetical protein